MNNLINPPIIEKKPSGVKWINGLLIFQLVMTTLLLVFGIIILFNDVSSNPFLRGMKTSMSRSGIFGESGNQAESLGFLIGSVFLPQVFIILALIGSYKRIFALLITAISLQILFGLAGGIPFIAIAVLIIAVSNPNRDFLKKKSNNADIADRFR